MFNSLCDVGTVGYLDLPPVHIKIGQHSKSFYGYLTIWLVVWNIYFIFPYLGNFIIATDFHTTSSWDRWAQLTPGMAEPSKSSNIYRSWCLVFMMVQWLSIGIALVSIVIVMITTVLFIIMLRVQWRSMATFICLVSGIRSMPHSLLFGLAMAISKGLRRKCYGLEWKELQ